ncbi:DUF1329 domain-containing protein [Pseudomonas citronellolis]|uniref:DUF1329 domain-containing protein n=1 Tax=Pseudomonas citronellolis TaxID=53408 RepID=UPI0021C1F50A|nr:DUF1329 domain-containing protein [Pseudomonas citronellolis]UXJ50229.1 DUF1329 domain-containing protein [Pseudomonas citronellolis]
MKLHSTLLAMSILAAETAHAAVSQQEAAELGKSRTPWGAIVAGNAAGTIPAYTGGLPTSTSPAGFQADSGFWANPYADDKPLFVITAKNVEQYADQLSEGTKELLKRFPESYSVSVYPSRRSANYPDWVNQNSIANASRCKNIENGLAVEGCFGGIPFPVPKTGNEVVWNAQLHYKGPAFVTTGQGWYVDAKGSKVLTAGIVNTGNSQYYNKELDVDKFASVGLYLTQLNVYNAPARNVGEGNLQKFYVNPIKDPNATWNYSPGQRRVRRAPDAEYDFPVSTSGGAMLYDEIYMFSGKQDRYDMKYLGVKEMIIPYNNYDWTQTPAEKLLADRHPNPDVMRWELHRVHVVELNLKPGMRHVQPKRRIYYDEDIFSAGMSDAWDASGKLAKAVYSPSYQMYDKQIPHSSSFWMYDFATGVYYHSSIGGSAKGIRIQEMKPLSYFTPESLARQSQR